MGRFDKISHTICYSIWNDGWVTDEDLQLDIDFGRRWPKGGRDFYKENGHIINKTIKNWPILKSYLWPMGYSYIKATSHYMKGNKLKSAAWWVPFLALVPGGLIICLILIYLNKNSE